MEMKESRVLPLEVHEAFYGILIDGYKVARNGQLLIFTTLEAAKESLKTFESTKKLGMSVEIQEFQSLILNKKVKSTFRTALAKLLGSKRKE